MMSANALRVSVLLLAGLGLTPARAAPAGQEAFVAAFGAACIPQRLSYEGTVALAEKLGWRRVVAGEDATLDRFIAFAAERLRQEVAEDPELYRGSDIAWFTREVGGRRLVLAANQLLTRVIDIAGCYLYDFGATAPLDPEPVTKLLGQPVAYTSDGGDPAYAIDPRDLVTTVWGPPPALPRTLDTYMIFVPEGSPHAAQVGFTGLVLKFSTSLPDAETK